MKLSSLSTLLLFARNIFSATSTPLDETSWVSLDGQLADKHLADSLAIDNSGNIASSGYHDKGGLLYDGDITILSPEGELTHNFMVEAGSSTLFRATAWYNDSVYSAGYVTVDGQNDGLLCQTNSNTTVESCLKLTGFPESSELFDMLFKDDGTCSLVGSDALLADYYPNQTLAVYQYPMPLPVTFSSITKTSDTNTDECIIGGTIQSSPTKCLVMKIDKAKNPVWTRELSDINGGLCSLESVQEQSGVVFAVGRLGSNGAVIPLNTTTGKTINDDDTKVDSIGGSTPTMFRDATLVDGKLLSVGRSRVNAVGIFDAILYFKNQIHKVTGARINSFQGVAVTPNKKITTVGFTTSDPNNLNFNEMLSVQVDPNTFSFDASDFPEGLGFAPNVTSDFEITHPSINNQNISGSFTRILYPAGSVYFENIINQTTITHPIQNLFRYAPTSMPTAAPSGDPTNAPSSEPTADPTFIPTAPTFIPTAGPSWSPSALPTWIPSAIPTWMPSGTPSGYPSAVPSNYPSAVPSFIPTAGPSWFPSALPTWIPSAIPTWMPSGTPSGYPSAVPSN
ncbi:MAG: hypothetical protein P1U32_09515, partial [Legionellaceae bacterium]|nr:hypothetical protein [Legionellaceae bacterium]